MTEDQKQTLVDQLDHSREFLEKFFHFKVNTQVQLLSNQFQYLQSLGGISLAVLSVLLGTGVVTLSFWWILTVALALGLVVYVSTNIRETVDLKALELVEAETSLNKNHSKTEEAILRALKENDFDSYISFRKKEFEISKEEEEEIKKAPPLYDGEIAIFLFLLMLLTGSLAILDKQGYFSAVGLVLLFLGGSIYSFLISMKDWNRNLTKDISTILHFLLGK